MRGRDDPDVGQLAGDQRALLGSHHAHRDVGLAPQQVAQSVGGHQLDGNAGLGALQRGQHRRQQPGRRDLAGRDAHRAAGGAGGQRQAAHDPECSGLHLARGIDQRACRAGRRHATPGTFEQRHAELGFELGDMAAQGRLLRAGLARRPHQAAGVEHRQEAAHQRPVEAHRVLHVHTKVYSWIPFFGNCRMGQPVRHWRHSQPPIQEFSR